jgi:hypothetical protein
MPFGIEQSIDGDDQLIISSFDLGDYVVMSGLVHRQELNGTVGFFDSVDCSSERCVVMVSPFWQNAPTSILLPMSNYA